MAVRQPSLELVNRKEVTAMKLALRYSHYALTALASVALGVNLQ
jgi:hypothetical protein